MADKKVRFINLNNQILTLGGDGILSFPDIATMASEPIANLQNGAIGWVDSEQKYFQWLDTNNISEMGYWRELVLGGKFQVKEMPVPTAELDGDVVQFIGETNATYKKGWFYTCVFANEGYVQTSCTADTRGDYYLKGDDGNYILVQLDGTNFDSSATYYQKVNAVSRWDEISTQSTDNKVDKIDGKGLSTNDLTDELKENYDNASDKVHSHENKTVLDTITEQNVTDWKDASEKAHSHENKEVIDKITQDNLDNWSDASTKAHEHTNKETLDKLNMSADGNLAVEKETDVSLELLYGKSLTKEQYEQMTTDGTIQDDMVYVVDEEDADAGWIINDSSTTATDKTWSAKKISGSTIPYVLMDVTKNIDLNEYVETGYYTPNKSFSTGWFTHDILHAPTEGWLPSGGFALEVKTFDNTGSAKWFTQVLYSYVGTDNNSAPIYTRTFFYDGSKVTFSPWKRVADIDDSKVTENETWSSKKINDTFVLKNSKKMSLSAPSSEGTTTFTFDISTLLLSHGYYHFKCYVLGNGNVSYFAEGGIGQYNGEYNISTAYKSSKIANISISGTTITITTDANYYIAGISIQSVDDWMVS